MQHLSANSLLTFSIAESWYCAGGDVPFLAGPGGDSLAIARETFTLCQDAKLEDPNTAMLSTLPNQVAFSNSNGNGGKVPLLLDRVIA